MVHGLNWRKINPNRQSLFVAEPFSALAGPFTEKRKREREKRGRKKMIAFLKRPSMTKLICFTLMNIDSKCRSLRVLKIWLNLCNTSCLVYSDTNSPLCFVMHLSCEILE